MALITDSNADVIMVDRRHAPGGHWNEAYPFVRLHQPSAFYGVNSLPLGSGAIDRHGPNEGFCEQASAPEICAYFDRVMQRHFLPSGRVRYFPMCNFVGDNRLVSRLSGEVCEIKVRKKLVDARYLETSVPASSAPPFDVAPEARCVPVNALASLAHGAARVGSRTNEPGAYVVVGAGKTAMDACVWLLHNGVSPTRIQWIKPREAWLQNRAFLQGGELVGSLFEGLALQLEAAAQARSVHRPLRSSCGQRAVPTRRRTRHAHHVPRSTLSTRELEQLRRIQNVVLLGKVLANRAGRHRARPGDHPDQPGPPSCTLRHQRIEPGS